MSRYIRYLVSLCDERGAIGTIGTLVVLGLLLGGGILANVLIDQGTQYFSKAQTPIEAPNCYFDVGQATGFRAGVPTQITAVASMDASQTAGDLGLEVFLDGFRRLQFQSFPGHTGTIQFNWTPTDADAQNVDPATGLSGFHNLRCRAWNDAKAECRPPALVVPGGLQYACAGNGNNQGEIGIRVLPASGTTIPPLTCAVTMQGPPYSGGSTYQLTADVQGGGGAYTYNWSVIDGVNNSLPFGTVANPASQTGLWTAPTNTPNGSTGIIRLNVSDTAGNATECLSSGQVYQPTPVTKTWSFTFDAQCADGTILNSTQLPQTWYWFDAPTTQNPQGTAQPLTINGNDTSTYVLLTQPDVTQLPLTPLIFPPQMSLDTANPNRLTWAGSNLPAGTYNITMTASSSVCAGTGGTGPKPDLTISRIFLSQSGATSLYQAEICNNGQGTSTTQFGVRFTNVTTGQSSTTGPVNGYDVPAPGQCGVANNIAGVACDILGDPTCTASEITAEVDFTNVIDEEDETNNTLTHSFLPKPDLTISRLFLGQSGSTPVYQAEICNNGQGTSTTQFGVRFTNVTTGQSSTTGPVNGYDVPAPGQCGVANNIAGVACDILGDPTCTASEITAEVDFTNVIDEEDETNNTLTHSFVTGGTGGTGTIGPLICDHQTPGATCDALSLLHDILVLTSLSLGFTTLPPVHNADVNGDGPVDFADVRYVAENNKIEFIRINEVIQFRP